jgi:signal peptidase I
VAWKPGPLRDGLVLIAVFAVLLGGLFLYTGTWPPAVIVESSSMMHADNEVPYGRFGTIDPGDLVLVKSIDSPEDVLTLVENGPTHYGKPGDVVVYFPNNNRGPGTTPIIHRAVAYVEIRGSGEDVMYRVRWDPAKDCEGGATKDPADARWCVYGQDGVYIPSVPVARLGSSTQNPQPYKPDHTGFLTKGDNPVSNRNIDQVSGLATTVQLSWVEGKGRGELPWLGLIKLSLSSHPNERNPPPQWFHVCVVLISCGDASHPGGAWAPDDLWVMLAVSLFILVGVPLLYDAYKAIRARRGGTASAPMLPPDPPRGLTSGRATLTFVELAWTPPEDATRVLEYRIYRDDAVAGTTRSTSYTDAGLDAGRTYSYAVTAVGPDGSESVRTMPVLVTTMAAAQR